MKSILQRFEDFELEDLNELYVDGIISEIVYKDEDAYDDLDYYDNIDKRLFKLSFCNGDELTFEELD